MATEEHRDDAGPAAQARRGTGIPGLDSVLCGGLLEGAAYLVRGRSGAGKTILANQICFHYAARGRRCIYLTVLSESHDRLLSHMSQMAFYQPSLVPDSIYYESGFGAIQSDGLKGLLHLITTERRTRDAALVVVDGLFVHEARDFPQQELRMLVNALANLAYLTGATVLLLTNNQRGLSSPEYTIVDGWMELGVDQAQFRTFRYLQVHKYRGSAFLPGRHRLTISRQGISVLPRLEMMPRAGQRRKDAERPRLSVAIPGLDAMLEGGLRRASATLVFGPTGIGKTTVGLSFLSRCSPEKPGLLFGFYETADDLLAKAQSLGIDLDGPVSSGALEILWHPPTENQLDELGYELIQAIRRQGTRRLFVDGVDALRQSAFYPARLSRFFSSLTNTLRDEGVTTIYTLDIPRLMGGEIDIEFGAISALAENVILLRYLELRGTIQRSVCVVKTRLSGFDPAIREFSISPAGIQVGEPFDNSDDVLTGHAHTRAKRDDNR